MTMVSSGKKLKKPQRAARLPSRKVGNSWLVQAVLTGLILSVVIWPQATVNSQSTCNPPVFKTGKTITADFCRYWLDNGGVSIFGEPITDPAFEISPQTGERLLTQWFERHRFELHPKSGGGSEVRLGKLGLELRAEAINKGPVGEIDPDFRPAAPLGDPDFPADQQMYFDQTKHNLRFKFLDYWKKNGGEERLGLPISEERLEFEPETQRYFVTQWFERARMEYHPENQTTTDVLLGLLGAQLRKPDAERQKRLDFQWKLGRSGTFLDQPNSVFVDGTGNIYINDRASGRIDKYNSKYKLVNYWFMVGGGTRLPALEGGTQAIAGFAKAPPNNTLGGTPAPTPTPTPKPSVSPTPGQAQEKPPILYSLAPNKTNLVRRLMVTGEWQTIELKPSGDADSDTPNFGLAVGSDESIYVLKSAAYANYLVFKYNAKGDFINKFVRRGEVTDPTAIAVSGDKLYLADGNAGKYFVFDSADNGKGEALNKDGFNLPGIGKPRTILSIAVDANGNVMVGETGKITRFDSRNSGPLEFPITAGRAVGQLMNPAGMVTDLKGNLYVADPANHRVIVVDQAGNPRDRIESEPFNLDGNLGAARSVVVTSGSSSLVLVADPVNEVIQKFDATGKFLSRWTAKGVASLAVSPAGEVYGLNTGQATVTKFDIDGKQLAQWGGVGADKGKFRFPGGIAVGKDGSVFVADTGNQRIQKFDPKGAALTTWGTKGPGEKEFGGSGLSDLYSGPTSIAVEPSSGNLYVVDSASARIIKYDPNGAFLGVLTQANVDPSRPFEPIAVAAPAFQVEKQQSSSVNTTPGPASSSVDDTGLTNGIYIMALQGIYKLNAQDGLSFTYFAAAPLPGTDGGDGNIHNLTGLAVDNNGNIFTTDNFSRLQKFRYK